MKILFWNTDTQKDFIEPNGKLYIKGAEKLKSNLSVLTTYANRMGLNIVSTADFHTKNSKELSDKPDFKTTFPEHCIAGTEGQEFIKETAPQLQDHSYYIINYTQKIIEPKIGRAKNIIIYKDAFDVFKGNTLTEKILKKLEPNLVVVYGVAGDVCVDFAVQGIFNRYYNVIVVKDAIKCLPTSDLDRMCRLWEEFGIIVMSTKSVINLINTLTSYKGMI